MPEISEGLTIPFAIGKGAGSSVGGFAGRLINKLRPWMTPDLELYCRAIAVMFEPALALAEEEGTDGRAGYIPSWGKLLNPQLCPAPALPYLAQFVGVTIPVGMPAAEARTLIKSESGLERGTLASIEAAVRRAAPEANLAVFERETPSGVEDAYHLTIIVTPGAPVAAIEAAVREVKPGGVILHVVEAEGLVWDEAVLTWEQVAEDVTWDTVDPGDV